MAYETDDRDDFVDHNEGDDHTLNELGDFLRRKFDERIARVKEAAERANAAADGTDDKKKTKVPTPRNVPVTVRLDHNSNGVPVTVEVFPATVETLPASVAEAVYARAADEARAIGGGSYFVSVDGVNGRYALSFPGVGMVTRPNGGYDMTRGRDPYGYSKESGGHRTPFVEQNPMAVAIQNIATSADRAYAQMLDMTKTILADARAREVETRRREEMLHGVVANSLRAQIDGAAAYQEMLDRGAERKLAARRAEKEEDRKDKVLETLAPVAMGVAAQLMPGAGPMVAAAMGAKPAPAPGGAVGGDAAEVVRMAGAAFKDMSPEQVQKIITSGIFTGAQIEALVKILNTINAGEVAGNGEKK